MLKPVAKQSIFVFVVMALIIGADLLLARLVLFYKPWRTSEVVSLAVITLVCGFTLSYATGRQPRLKLFLVGLLATGWLIVGAAYGFSYRANYRANVRPILNYVAWSRVLAKSAETPLGSAELADHFRMRPPVQLEKLPNFRGSTEGGDLELRAAELMASRLRFLSYPAVTVPEDLSWDEDPFGDRSWNFELHNMGYVAVLARAYAATEHLPYIERAEALTLDWIGDNSGYSMSPPSEFVWNDHTTAIRLGSWLVFWEAWTKSPAFSQKKMEQVLGSMIAHAERLASSDFYTENHNHGIDQDLALLGFALLFPEMERSDTWRELALQRLALQLTQTISPKGVQLEHSPGYHLLLMETVQDVGRMLRDFDIEDQFGFDLTGLYGKMARFASTTIQPNGLITPIGDTSGNIDSYAALDWSVAETDPWLEYHVSSGRSGILQDTVMAYPEEGYAVIRDFDGGSLTYDRSFYLFFTSAANEVTGIGHKHADDLSFVLVYGGRDFLIDSGQYSYKRDEGRDYVKSSRAHNVVLVDGDDFRGWESSFDAFTTSPDHTVIRASHRNYPNFEHKRWIVHIRPAKVFVIDEIRPLVADQRHHMFEQLFHFAADLDVRTAQNGQQVIASPGSIRGDSPTLRLTQLHGAFDARVVAGQRAPMLGWRSLEHGVLEPSPVAVFTTRGESALYVTLIDFIKADQEGAKISRGAGNVSVSDGDELLITWREGDGTRRLRVDRMTGNVELTWK